MAKWKAAAELYMGFLLEDLKAGEDPEPRVKLLLSATEEDDAIRFASRSMRKGASPDEKKGELVVALKETNADAYLFGGAFKRLPFTEGEKRLLLVVLVPRNEPQKQAYLIMEASKDPNGGWREGRLEWSSNAGNLSEHLVSHW
jgi:hypothetical protein